MGTLYTTFQVMVLQEVTADVHPYFSPGWCYSEVCQALLAKKMGAFSVEAIDAYKKWLFEQGQNSAILEQMASGLLSEEDVMAFSTLFDGDFANKKFFNEADRQAVDGIVKSFL